MCSTSWSRCAVHRPLLFHCRYNNCYTTFCGNPLVSPSRERVYRSSSLVTLRSYATPMLSLPSRYGICPRLHRGDATCSHGLPGGAEAPARRSRLGGQRRRGRRSRRFHLRGSGGHGRYTDRYTLRYIDRHIDRHTYRHASRCAHRCCSSRATRRARRSTRRRRRSSWTSGATVRASVMSLSVAQHDEPERGPA